MDKDDVANESDLDQDNNVIESEMPLTMTLKLQARILFMTFYGDDETESTILSSEDIADESWRRFQQ